MRLDSVGDMKVGGGCHALECGGGFEHMINTDCQKCAIYKCFFFVRNSATWRECVCLVCLCSCVFERETERERE